MYKEPNAKKKILLTGGCGHIGSAIIRNSIYKDYDITVADNMSTQRYCSLMNLSHPITFWDRDFVTLSVRDLSSFDVIIHLAARTDATASFSSEEEFKRVNVTDTTKLILRASEAGVGLFVFPSSTSVYGKAMDIMREEDDNIDPQSPYASGKLAVEQVLRSSFGINYVILRLGTIYGVSPGMRFHTAINKFCWQAALGQKLTVWRQNYDQYRPYLGIFDAMVAIDWVINQPHCFGETFNIISGCYKPSEIVELIRGAIAPRALDVQFVDTPLLNQHSYLVDDSKIRRAGWFPLSPLQPAIAATLRLFEGIRLAHKSEEACGSEEYLGGTSPDSQLETAAKQ